MNRSPLSSKAVRTDSMESSSSAEDRLKLISDGADLDSLQVLAENGQDTTDLEDTLSLSSVQNLLRLSQSPGAGSGEPQKDAKDQAIERVMQDIYKVRKALRYVIQREQGARERLVQEQKAAEDLREENRRLRLDREAQQAQLAQMKVSEGEKLAALKRESQDAVREAERKVSSLAMSMSNQILELQHHLEVSRKAKEKAIAQKLAAEARVQAAVEQAAQKAAQRTEKKLLGLTEFGDMVQCCSNQIFVKRYGILAEAALQEAEEAERVNVLAKTVAKYVWMSQCPGIDVPNNVLYRVGIEQGENTVLMMQPTYQFLESMRAQQIQWNAVVQIQAAGRRYMCVQQYKKARQRRRQHSWESSSGGRRRRSSTKVAPWLRSRRSGRVGRAYRSGSVHRRGSVSSQRESLSVIDETDTMSLDSNLSADAVSLPERFM